MRKAMILLLVASLLPTISIADGLKKEATVAFVEGACVAIRWRGLLYRHSQQSNYAPRPRRVAKGS